MSQFQNKDQPPPYGFVGNMPATTSQPPLHYEAIQSQPTVINNVIMLGGCPVCRIGRIKDKYSCLGICCAIFCFPLGILCCLICTNKKCSNCGAKI